MEVPWGQISLKIFIVGLVLSTRIVVVWTCLCNLKLDCTRLSNNCECGGWLCFTFFEVNIPKRVQMIFFWNELSGNTFENTLKGQRSVRLPWIAKVWLEKPTFRSGKWKLSSPSYGSGLRDLIKSWCLLNQNGQSTTKVDSMKPCFLMKKVFALQCHKAGPSGWPWKWTDDSEASFEDVWIP